MDYSNSSDSTQWEPNISPYGSLNENKSGSSQQSLMNDIFGQYSDSKTKNNENKKEEHTETIEYVEALNEYYQLKSAYEKNNENNKNKIIKNPTKSWKEKRMEFQRLKPKCITCKRPVGTRFTRTYDSKEMATILKSVCGSLSDPCDLHIELKSTQSGLYPDIIQHLEKEINEYKLDIIMNKNKLIFGYITSEEVVQKFDELRETIQETSDILAYYLDEYIELLDSKEKNTELKELTERSYLMIHDMKELIQKYNANQNNTQLIQDVVDIYVNQLSPLVKELRENKYKKNKVEYNPDKGTFHLIQKPHTLEDITFYYSTPEIIAFVKNTKQMERKKVLETKELQETSLQEKEEEKELQKLSLENFELTLEYQQIWKGLDENYKSYLEKDLEWKKETMEAYIQYKREGKPRVFVNPSNLILPPIVTENGEYDFGNETYNEIINKIPKAQIISLRVENQKNLSFLDKQLKAILGNKFRLTKF